jgi:hypothetical protein
MKVVDRELAAMLVVLVFLLPLPRRARMKNSGLFRDGKVISGAALGDDSVADPPERA